MACIESGKQAIEKVMDNFYMMTSGEGGKGEQVDLFSATSFFPLSFSLLPSTLKILFVSEKSFILISTLLLLFCFDCLVGGRYESSHV